MRLTSIAAVLVAATPLHANPLPQGDFIVGSRIWADEWLPRYANVTLDGTGVTLTLSSPIPLNHAECGTTGDCVYTLVVATAQASGENQMLSLSDIDIALSPPSSVWDDAIPPAAYAEQLLDLVNGAPMEESADGFTLTTSEGAVPFLRATADTRNAIQAYAVNLELSINQLGGCEVAGLAPLLMADEGIGAEATFRHALMGFARLLDINNEANAVNPPSGDPAQADRAQARAFMARVSLPALLARAADGGPVGQEALDAVWDTYGAVFWLEDRDAFDADIAGFDGTPIPLARFLAHLQTTQGPITSATACRDLSFGFIAAQEGG